MTAAFAALAATLFADPNMAETALWFAGGAGPGVAVRVIRRSPDSLTNFDDARIATGSAMFDVRVSEVAEPDDGDRIEVGDQSYRVQGAPLLDDLGLFWQVQADPQHR